MASEVVDSQPTRLSSHFASTRCCPAVGTFSCNDWLRDSPHPSAPPSEGNDRRRGRILHTSCNMLTLPSAEPIGGCMTRTPGINSTFVGEENIKKRLRKENKTRLSLANNNTRSKVISLFCCPSIRGTTKAVTVHWLKIGYAGI